MSQNKGFCGLSKVFQSGIFKEFHMKMFQGFPWCFRLAFGRDSHKGTSGCYKTGGFKGVSDRGLQRASFKGTSGCYKTGTLKGVSDWYLLRVSNRYVFRCYKTGVFHGSSD